MNTTAPAATWTVTDTEVIDLLDPAMRITLARGNDEVHVDLNWTWGAPDEYTPCVRDETGEFHYSIPQHLEDIEPAVRKAVEAASGSLREAVKPFEKALLTQAALVARN